jgi:hypothetical protein
MPVTRRITASLCAPIDRARGGGWPPNARDDQEIALIVAPRVISLRRDHNMVFLIVAAFPPDCRVRYERLGHKTKGENMKKFILSIAVLLVSSFFGIR